MNDKLVDRSTFHRGSRTGLLLVHGLGGTPIELRFVAQGLARAGYTVYCCQLEGHGGSFNDLRRSTWRQWYASVVEALDRLRETCDVIIAGGLSTGALLAMHLAHQRGQDVAGLLLYAPSLRLDGWAMPWYMDLLHLVRPTPLPLELKLSDRHPYGFKDERIRRLVLQSLMSGESGEAGIEGTPLRTFAHFNALASVVKRELREIETPTLILHPREDDVASLSNALLIQRDLSGLVELVVLNDCYHMITMDRQRHIVVDRTVGFVERMEARYVDVGRGPIRLHRRRGEN